MKNLSILFACMLLASTFAFAQEGEFHLDKN